ncbi:fructose-2,6-bisphosphatase TIGAR-like [Pollicipes pollicipes]|uniref:fructose-2,6-bisphosphatase TIGAR-like n=1 Tax=Pollicipes pollicipes TaxID=41117 RepID=UPI001884CECE|nr:fructose-2,6-bisphosphatase TIGAR-like [Pollicipes pollicipes]
MNLADAPGGARKLLKLRPSLLLTLVRHGQSEGNRQQLIQGQSDYPLSELGVRQAEALRHHLVERGVTFDAVYSSDLQRARQTCDVVAGGLPVTEDQRLREKNYGVCENQPVSELFVPAGGESQQQVRARAGAFFRDVCQHHLSDQCTRVLVTSHGCLIRELIGHLFETYHGNLKKADANRIAPNTGVSVVHVARAGSEPDSLTLHFLKMHSDEHLGNVASTAPPGV